MMALVGLIALGLVGLLAGSELVVRGGGRAAARADVSELVVGLTVAAVGTSLPELATTVAGALASGGEAGEQAAGVAVGNILGSNLFLLTALLGAASLLGTLRIDLDQLRRDGSVLAVVTLSTVLASLDHALGRLDGGLLVLSYLAFLGLVLVQERRRPGTVASEADVARGRDGLLDAVPGPAWAVDLVAVGVGFAMLVTAADVVVARGVEVAEVLGISGTLIGILVGIGTSLPELVLTTQAVWRGSVGLAIGNVLGSAITNLCLCLGLAAALSPLPVPAVALWYDLPFVVATTLVALALMVEQRDVTRREGGVLLTLFALYVFVRVAWVQ